MDAFRRHGRPRASLEEGIADARDVMAALEQQGIFLDQVTVFFQSQPRLRHNRAYHTIYLTFTARTR